MAMNTRMQGVSTTAVITAPDGQTKPALEDINVTSGAVLVSGAPGNIERITAATFTGACNGCAILLLGTGNLTLSPISGDTDIVITAAELTAMGVFAYKDWIARCDMITAGTGMSVLIYK